MQISTARLPLTLTLPTGTVEFMVDKNGQHYFLEVNPRIQVGPSPLQQGCKASMSCARQVLHLQCSEAVWGLDVDLAMVCWRGIGLDCHCAIPNTDCQLPT